MSEVRVDPFLDRRVGPIKEALQAAGMLAVSTVAVIAAARGAQTYHELSKLPESSHSAEFSDEQEVNAGVALNLAVTSGLVAGLSTFSLARRSRRYVAAYQTTVFNDHARDDFNLSAQQELAALIHQVENRPHNS